MDGFLFVLERVLASSEREELLIVTCCSIVRKVFVVCRNLDLSLLHIISVLWNGIWKCLCTSKKQVTIVIHPEQSATNESKIL